MVHDLQWAHRQRYEISRNVGTGMGVDRWGRGGDASPPAFQLGGDHIGNVPPLFCLKSGKSHMFLSPSNLHSFVSLRNRHRLVEIASERVPPPSPTDLMNA